MKNWDLLMVGFIYCKLNIEEKNQKACKYSKYALNLR